jgi:hypothetical protein
MPAWQIVKEKRATFSATPEQDAKRPPARTRWRNLFLAGDWTATGLPATIEGALRSGETAARTVLARRNGKRNEHDRSHHCTRKSRNRRSGCRSRGQCHGRGPASRRPLGFRTGSRLHDSGRIRALRHFLGEPDDLELEAKIGRYLRRIQSKDHHGWACSTAGLRYSASVKAYYALKMIGDDINAAHGARARAIRAGAARRRSMSSPASSLRCSARAGTQCRRCRPS